MPVFKATEIKLWYYKKKELEEISICSFKPVRSTELKKNSIGVSQISKILIGCHNSVSNKALGIWGLNEELRWEGQCRAFRDAQKKYLGMRDYSRTWIITEMSHPTLYSNFRTWPNLACSRLSDSRGDSVFSRFIFVFSLSQFSGPNYLGAWNRLGLIRQKLCHHYQVRAETKTFSKCISNTHISISFLFIWNWNDKYVHSCTLP